MLAGRGVRGKDGGQEGEKDVAAKGRGRKGHVKGSGPCECRGLRTKDTEGWAGSAVEMETGMLSQNGCMRHKAGGGAEAGRRGWVGCGGPQMA